MILEPKSAFHMLSDSYAVRENLGHHKGSSPVVIAVEIVNVVFLGIFFTPHFAFGSLHSLYVYVCRFWICSFVGVESREETQL